MKCAYSSHLVDVSIRFIPLLDFLLNACSKVYILTLFYSNLLSFLL